MIERIFSRPSGTSVHKEYAHAVFFASGHAVVTTSATAIPSDTSRNRCNPVIQGARARGISKMMLSRVPLFAYFAKRVGDGGHGWI